MLINYTDQLYPHRPTIVARLKIRRLGVRRVPRAPGEFAGI